MESKIEGAPAFAHVHVKLAPGDTIILEPDAMASMSPQLEMKTRLNGGLIKGLLKKFLGGESLFINEFRNTSQTDQQLVFTQATPGAMKQIDLNDGAMALQPGAFIGATPGIKLGVKWAGFISWFSGMGLFKLVCTGTGTVWFGGYGGLLFKSAETPFIIDNDHLVAMEPGVTLKPRLAGGIFSSFFGGEGVVLEVSGKGNVAIQTRSMNGLASWTNSKL